MKGKSIRGIWVSIFGLLALVLAWTGCSDSQPQANEVVAADQQEEAADYEYIEQEDASAAEGEQESSVPAVVVSEELPGSEEAPQEGEELAVAPTGEAVAEASAGEQVAAETAPSSEVVAQPEPSVDSIEQLAGESSIPAAAESQQAASSPESVAAAPAAETEVKEEAVMADRHFQYKIVKGDWLSKIAGRVYGDVHKWPVIAKANPQIQNPNRIFPKHLIKIPVINQKAEDFAKAYGTEVSAQNGENTQSDKAVTIKVEQGDTLSDIAERVLGDAQAWTSIWEQNKEIVPNPNALQVGTTLTFVNAFNPSV